MINIDFRPKLVDALRHYDREQFWRDVTAGITVGIVALPLSMAFAIASGLKPEAGIFTAIIAGFIISALGGSRVQIGGPAGAFIVIVYGIVERFGVANLIIATAMSGVLLFAMGLFKLGSLVRFIPISVVIGFTNGIAVLVALSQIKDFFGLQVGKMPADFFGIIRTVYNNLYSWSPQTLLVSLGSLAIIVLWQRGLSTWLKAPKENISFSRHSSHRRHSKDTSPQSHAEHHSKLANKLTAVAAVLPGAIVALIVATLAVSAAGLEVETIGSKFGNIPAYVPEFAWPAFSWQSVRFLLIPTLTLALLGAIESLLCARVADGLIGDRHNPNQELMAQGVANFVTPFFGGMPATGTIARTMTNIKSGAVSPVAGMVHAIALLVIVLIAAPWASHVPLATLSAILMFVAWNMGEWREFMHLRQLRKSYGFTLLAVFLLTVIFDLTVAVEVGLIAACLTFIYRISSLSRYEPVAEEVQPALTGLQGQVDAYRLYGALFFGAVKLLEEIEDKLPSHALVLDLKNVIYLDPTGADALSSLARKCRKEQVRLLICGLARQPLEMAQRDGLLDELKTADLYPNLTSGIAAATAEASSNTV
jgi:sulfate permease, SulP family